MTNKALNVRKQEKEAPLLCRCDVAVAGGGVAGIAAALAAARQGADVALLEKQCVLGGLATSGLVTVYLPLCDGRGNQVSYGLAEELFRLSVRYGAQRKYPKAWLEGGTKEERIAKRYEVQFNPVYFQLLAERLLKEAGVRIFYDTLVSQAVLEIGTGEKAFGPAEVSREVSSAEKRIKELIVETAEGRGAVRAKSYVDATGDARVFRAAGAPVQKYEKGNILAAWYYGVSGGRLMLRQLGTVEESDCMSKERHTDKPLSSRRFGGMSWEDNSQFLQLAHEQMLLDMEARRREDKDFEAALIPGMAQFRMICRIEGKASLRQKDRECYLEESIGMAADWRRRGYVYEIPFGCLCASGFPNIFAAGRIISSDEEMWEVSRVIPACAVTGEAAGIGAALHSQRGQVDLQQLQDCLREQKQILHFREI